MSDSADLPPMPDRQTGEPRPPRGPVHKPSNEKRQPWNARKVPQPPEGNGPPLEWEYGDRRAQIWTFSLTAVIIIMFGTIYNAGFGWVADWEFWVIILATSSLLALGARSVQLSAGADWLMKRKDIVATYELTSVRFEKSWSEGTLVVHDRHGSGIREELSYLRINERLWDLVYNGIRHSVANGATVNDLAVRQLRLHDVVATRDQRAQDQAARDDPP